jgi:hypothetical protein
MTSQLALVVDGQSVSGALRAQQSRTVELPAKAVTVEFVDAQTSKPVGDPQKITAAPGHCYTMVVARETTGPLSEVKPLLVPMECKAPEAGKANATFVLASPSVEKVDVYAGWFKIISNLKKGSFQGPATVPAGEYKVVAKEDGKAVLGPIELSPKAGHSYTIVAFDNGGSAEGERLTHRVYDDDFTSSTK